MERGGRGGDAPRDAGEDGLVAGRSRRVARADVRRAAAIRRPARAAPPDRRPRRSARCAGRLRRRSHRSSRRRRRRRAASRRAAGGPAAPARTSVRASKSNASRSAGRSSRTSPAPPRRACEAQARRDDPRLVEHQHVARPQERREVGEGRVAMRAVRLRAPAAAPSSRRSAGVRAMRSSGSS